MNAKNCDKYRKAQVYSVVVLNLFYFSSKLFNKVYLYKCEVLTTNRVKSVAPGHNEVLDLLMYSKHNECNNNICMYMC